MTRRRFRQDAKTGILHEIFPTRGNGSASAAVHNDIQPFMSTVDGTMISSRSEMREHNKRNNVINDPDYIKEVTTQHQNREVYTGTKHERKLAIADAIERAESSGYHRNVRYDE